MIGSHTIRGRVVLEQLDIIEAEGYRADRFIAIHAQIEPDFGLNRAVAARGAFIEYDNIGQAPDGPLVERVLAMLADGRLDQLLLSHDLGWYDPAQPGGGTPRPYTHLMSDFLPLLRAEGVDEATITRITHDNPFDAYAR